MRTFPLFVLFLLLPLTMHQPAGAQGTAGGPPRNGPDSGELSTRDTHYDPMESINYRVFEFNSGVDRFVLKPVAQGYAAVVPPPVQTGIHNAIDNLGVVRKVVNNLLQGKPLRAVRETVRFVINSTVGMAGLVDMASKMGLEPSDQDMGITLGLSGASHGAYLVLPLLPVTTVRDGIGTVADSLMDPLTWLTPFYVPLSIRVAGTVNNRARNMKAYEELEESIDPYGALRNAYLQIRQNKLEKARAEGL